MITNNSPSGPPKNRVKNDNLFNLAVDLYPLKRKGRISIEINSENKEGLIEFRDNYETSFMVIRIRFEGPSKFDPPYTVVNTVNVYVDRVELELERQDYQGIYRTMVSILEKEREFIKNKNEEDKQDLFSFLKELKKEYGIK
jgi:hypothetical protein